MKLLVCIAAHYVPERIKYLERVLENLKTYQCEIDIIVDSNTGDWKSEYFQCINPERANKIEYIPHGGFSHPFNLTQIHREHFKRELNNYDWMMYLEDDMLVSWENFLEYTKKFNFLWPNYVPSFIRIEEKEGKQYISDVTEHYKINEIIKIEGREFIALPFPQHYHAFWIAPTWVLKQTIDKKFTKLHDNRESAASYLMWELQKKGLLEIMKKNEKYQIKEDCYSWHLPSNYIDSGMPNGKILVEEIFI